MISRISARRSVIPMLLALAPACFAAPKGDEPVDVESSGIGLGGTDGAPYESSGSDAPGTDETTSSEDEGTPVDDDTSSDGGELDTGDSGDVDSGDTSTTEGGNGWNEDDVPPGFPAIEPFGDDVRELDLVGTWTTPWDPTGVADIELTIAGDGSFVWHERAADCSEVGSAHGNLWVSGSQLVVHVDVWGKRAPWDTEAELGFAIAAPWRMRLGYTPMGGFLGLAAPPAITAIGDWAGRGYVRIDAGVGPMSSWVAESELWAMPPGEGGPRLVARDRFDAHVGAAGGNGSAQLVHGSTWWWPQQQATDEVQQVGSWSDETPGNLAGAATVIGVPHAYDPSGLISFTADRSFKLGVTSDCE